MKVLRFLYLYSLLVFLIGSSQVVAEVKVSEKIKPVTVLVDEGMADSIVAAGTVDGDCAVYDQGNIYLAADAKRSAERRLIEGRLMIYGVANGPGPIYPGGYHGECEKKIDVKIILWPTKGCGKDLTFDQAFEYARIFNKHICELLL